ncbi:MAG: flagellar P-ring protein [Fimbriimonadales bacterium]
MRALIFALLLVNLGWSQNELPAAASGSDASSRAVRLKDIAVIRGARSNQLTGVGVVVGLEGTGDTKSTPQTQQAIANALERFGLSVNPASMSLKNVAIVLVTAELPAFAKPGTHIDVTVSSMGDAKSLQGGTLLQTPLYAAGNSREAFAVAAGPVSIGGFNFGAGGSSVQKNHVTVGRIPEGAIVEKSVPSAFVTDNNLFIQLRQPDFTTASNVAEAIMAAYPECEALAVDGATIRVTPPDSRLMDPVRLVSQLELLAVTSDAPAKIIVNERTGTIVIGENVRIRPAAVAHGGITVTIKKTTEVSQPPSFTSEGGPGVPFDNTAVKVKEPKAKLAWLDDMPTVADLVKALNQLGVSPRDLIAILQALRGSGALQATIEIQ